jgi:hypothetical protein
MTVEATEWTMISDITPESAYRETGAGDAIWRLSWLPERRLTRAQALAGMKLDEILSDPDAVHDRRMHAEAALLADTVGIIWEQAVILLYKRMIARLRVRSEEAQDECDPAPGPPGHTFRPRRVTVPVRRSDLFR